MHVGDVKVLNFGTHISGERVHRAGMRRFVGEHPHSYATVLELPVALANREDFLPVAAMCP